MNKIYFIICYEKRYTNYYKKLKFIKTGTQTQTVPRVIHKGLRRVDKINRL